jgi:hypothetical protein
MKIIYEKPLLIDLQKNENLLGYGISTCPGGSGASSGGCGGGNDAGGIPGGCGGGNDAGGGGCGGGNRGS